MYGQHLDGRVAHVVLGQRLGACAALGARPHHRAPRARARRSPGPQAVVQMKDPNDVPLAQRMLGACSASGSSCVNDAAPHGDSRRNRAKLCSAATSGPLAQAKLAASGPAPANSGRWGNMGHFRSNFGQITTGVRDLPANLERYRGDYHGPCARMQHINREEYIILTCSISCLSAPFSEPRKHDRPRLPPSFGRHEWAGRADMFDRPIISPQIA